MYMYKCVYPSPSLHLSLTHSLTHYSLLSLTFKSVFSGKTATQLRTAYLHCIPSLCRSKDHTASLLPQFLPILESSVDKSAGKSAQAAALEEGLVAVYILLELQGVGEIDLC